MGVNTISGLAGAAVGAKLLVSQNDADTATFKLPKSTGSLAYGVTLEAVPSASLGSLFGAGSTSVPVFAGGTFAPGDAVVARPDGKAIKLPTNENAYWVVGTAETAGAADKVAGIQFNPYFVSGSRVL